MSTPHPHQLVTCPFNMSHQIEHYRMQVHLAKCQKQHPNVRVVTCPFDATHIVKDTEIDHHVANCPARAMFDNQLYVTDDDYRPVVEVRQPQTDFTCSENWDEDNVEPYNPAQAKKGAPIIAKIKGATPSERRRFRMESRQQYAQSSREANTSEKE